MKDFNHFEADWISTDKEMPVTMVDVLVCLFYPNNEYEIIMAWYDMEEDIWHYSDEYNTPIDDDVDIAAWMPLPHWYVR